MLATLVGLISFTALLGYSGGVATLYGVAELTQMAIPTAMSFVLLALAVPLARPEHGVMRLLASRTAGGHTARRLLPAVVMIPPALGLLRLEGQGLGLYETSGARGCS